MGRSHEGGLGRIAVGLSRIGQVIPLFGHQLPLPLPMWSGSIKSFDVCKRVYVGASVLACIECGWSGACLLGMASPRHVIALMVPTCNLLHEL